MSHTCAVSALRLLRAGVARPDALNHLRQTASLWLPRSGNPLPSEQPVGTVLEETASTRPDRRSAFYGN
jgi:hypothetical protein